MTQQKKKKCISCKKDFLDKPESKELFCSSRCQMIDLSKWLKEEYAVPAYDNFEQ